MTGPVNMAISASAGSGKTFRLAHRYIELLALGVDPATILAVTFSRKASWEIFEKILAVLADAAEKEKAATLTTSMIGRQGMKHEDYLAILRTYVHALPRLQIGTLDAFIIGIIRSFPLELGMDIDLSILDENSVEAASRRTQVLRRILHAGSPRERTAFLEALKQATYGTEEKGLTRILNEWLSGYLYAFQELPEGAGWGNPSAIWPEQGAARLDEAERLGDRAEKVRSLAGEAGWPDKDIERWEAFIDAVPRHTPGTQWADDYFLKKLIEIYPDLEAGAAEIKIGRKAFPVAGGHAGNLAGLVRSLAAAELAFACAKTSGLFQVLSQFDAVYDRQVRRRGILTFSDALFLLARQPMTYGGTTREPIDRRALALDYRLDGRIDHWLIDEFQDTSSLQWSVLANLIDEVVQDTGGDRSFFYVGDVKQAIYSWRGGNPHLFQQVLNQYRPKIEEMPLSTSYRSSPVIMDIVNEVFGGLASLGPDLPADALNQWHKVWQEHVSAVNPGPAYAAIVEPVTPPDKKKPDAEDRYEVAAALINQLQPVARGIRTAVLVRSNKSGADVVSALREWCPGIPVVHEGESGIVDNPVATLMCSMLKFSAHPGDTYALRHIQMSPLAHWVGGTDDECSARWLEVRRQIQRHGFQNILREWITELERATEFSAFTRRRCQNLLDAAGRFDTQASRDADACIDGLRDSTIRDVGEDEAVRVMTIHQSKGLEFDAVILPDLQGSSGSRDRLHIARRPESMKPRWALLMPQGMWASHDATLQAELDREAVDDAFEDLCVLYVAMTRARRALYMVTSDPGASAKSMKNDAARLKYILCGDIRPEAPVREETVDDTDLLVLYEQEGGDRNWYTGCSRSVERKKVSARRKRKGKAPARRKRRLDRSSPFEQAEDPRAASLLFQRRTRDSLLLGTAVHAVMENMEWLDAASARAAVAAWQADTDPEAELIDHVGAHVRALLESVEAVEALERPADHAEVWREKKFELVLDDQWITGTFDRVVIRRDREGRAVSARILDYKTNQVEDETSLQEAVEHYRPQMDLYRRVLARLLSLQPDTITRALIFTVNGRVCEI